MNVLYPLAKRYIAGEDLPTALRSIKSLNQSGYLSSIDVLGENTTNRLQAESAMGEYIQILRRADAFPFPLDLSIKVTQMGLDVDKDLCKKNIEAILNSANQHTVRLDMEGSDYTQRTLDLCIELHKTHKRLGQAVQAYLHRTQRDVEDLIHQGISVRLCKGAYKEPPERALESMDDVRENFKKLSFTLLKEGFIPAIATHDEYLIQEILNFAEREKIDERSFYFEMLYGVGRDLQKLLLDKGFQVRVYVPYGKSWLPYTLRRLAERKENILFVLGNFFKETFGLRKLH